MDNLVEITGYVNVVERDSDVIPHYKYPSAPGPFVERVQAGAFLRSLKCGSSVQLMVDHKRLIGSTCDGTLKLSEDGIGLKATVFTGDREVIAAAQARHITGWSFGFKNPVDEWKRMEDGLYRRTLKAFELSEVSLLISAKPSYIATSAYLVDGSAATTERRTWVPPGDPLIRALTTHGLLKEIPKPQ